jgi:hypothetical protein
LWRLASSKRRGVVIEVQGDRVDLRLGEDREYPGGVAARVDDHRQFGDGGYLFVQPEEVVGSEGVSGQSRRVELNPRHSPAVLQVLYLGYHDLAVDVLGQLPRVPVGAGAYLGEAGEGVRVGDRLLDLVVRRQDTARVEDVGEPVGGDP